MSPTTSATQNKSILVSHPSTEKVVLVVGIVLDPETVDVERLLAGLVPEMAKGGVPGGLLVLGDSTLVLRLTDGEMLVDEVDTGELLALADVEDWHHEDLVELMQQWILAIGHTWRDRLVGRLRPVLVPHVVAGLGGDVQVVDGIWGLEAHRLAATLDDES